MKLQEQASFLSSKKFLFAVGTPNRISKLLEADGLSLQQTRLVVLDSTWKDAKSRNIFDVVSRRLVRWGSIARRRGGKGVCFCFCHWEGMGNERERESGQLPGGDGSIVLRVLAQDQTTKYLTRNVHLPAPRPLSPRPRPLAAGDPRRYHHAALATLPAALRREVGSGTLLTLSLCYLKNCIPNATSGPNGPHESQAKGIYTAVFILFREEQRPATWRATLPACHDYSRRFCNLFGTSEDGR